VQAWGDFYGKLTDRFGVQWMLSCKADLTLAQPQA
jgi:PhnB protein